MQGEKGGAQVEDVQARRVHENLERGRTAVVAGLLPLPQLEQQQLAPAVLPRNMPPAGSAPSPVTGNCTTGAAVGIAAATEIEARARHELRERGEGGGGREPERGCDLGFEGGVTGEGELRARVAGW
jgi:hypothetical protein